MSDSPGQGSIEVLNGSKSESAANTLTYESIEIPNSYGAKTVWVKRVQIDVDLAEIPAGANGTAYSRGSAIVGKVVPTSIELEQVGCITTKKSLHYSAGAGVPAAALIEGPEVYEGPIEVPRYQDGKYYITNAIHGAGNVAVKIIHYHWEFAVQK
jgi:hypothetical protein